MYRPQIRVALRWPTERRRVVLVDNASSDGAAAEVRTAMPEVTVVEPGANLGFAGGCNLGIRELTGCDYLALLNNDAVAEPGWLEHLVDAIGRDDRTGAASSKVVFASPYVGIALESDTFVPGRGDRRSLGVRVGGARVGDVDVWGRAQAVTGFWGPEFAEEHFQWTDGSAVLRLPASSGDDTAALLLAAEQERTVELSSGDESVRVTVGPDPRWCEVALAGPRRDVINSAGVILLDDGHGADRGYLEVDRGQYDKTEEVFAWSGAAVLLDARYLDDVGLFDERFFLYYEDFDLSWRGRLAGWRYVYAPGSVARHVHAASTGLTSSLLAHYVERNRLLALARSAPPHLLLVAIARFVAITLSYARRDLLSPLLRGRRPRPEAVRRRMRALGGFLRLLPGTLRSRRRVRRNGRAADAQILRWMVASEGAVVGTRS